MPPGSTFSRISLYRTSQPFFPGVLSCFFSLNIGVQIIQCLHLAFPLFILTSSFYNIILSYDFKDCQSYISNRNICESILMHTPHFHLDIQEISHNIFEIKFLIISFKPDPSLSTSFYQRQQKSFTLLRLKFRVTLTSFILLCYPQDILLIFPLLRRISI